MPRSRSYIVLIALILAACGGGGPPTIEDVTGRLVSPNGNEGAVVLELPDADANTLANLTVPANQSNVVLRTTGDRAIVVLRDAGEISLTLLLQEGDVEPNVNIVEVAGPDNTLRASLDGYRWEWVR